MAELQQLQIIQGLSLGPFVLGASIHDVLARIKSLPLIYPNISIAYSQSHPLLAPIVITLSNNGLRLRFDGPEQRLRLIEVLEFSPSRLVFKNHDICNPQGDIYKPSPFLPSKAGPEFRQVYKIFGPTTPGEYIPPSSKGEANGTYVLSYPGIAFSFPLKQGILNSTTTWSNTVSLLSSNATRPSTSLSIFFGESWESARSSLYDSDMSAFLRSPIPAGLKRDNVPREIELAKVHGRGRVELLRKEAPSFWLVVGETTPQDLVTELGPPDSIHKKPEGNMSVMRNRKNSSAANSRRGSSNLGMSPPTRNAQGNLPFDSDASSQADETESSDEDDEDVISEKDKDGSEQVFYNYYSHGFDILISNALPHQSVASPTAHKRQHHGGPSGSPAPPAPSTEDDIEPVVPRSHLVATKVIIHGNVPGSWPFNRHRRLRWTLESVPTDTAPHPLTSEMPFRDIQGPLQEVFHDSYATEEEERAASLPMVVNRALGREELGAGGEYGVIGSWEDGGTSSVRRIGDKAGEGEKIGGAEVYGFPGLVFEVLRTGAVSSLMVY